MKKNRSYDSFVTELLIALLSLIEDLRKIIVMVYKHYEECDLTLSPDKHVSTVSMVERNNGTV